MLTTCSSKGCFPEASWLLHTTAFIVKSTWTTSKGSSSTKGRQCVDVEIRARDTFSVEGDGIRLLLMVFALFGC